MTNEQVSLLSMCLMGRDKFLATFCRCQYVAQAPGCAIEDLSNRSALVRAATRPIDWSDTFCCVLLENVQTKTSFGAVVSAERSPLAPKAG